MVYVSGSWLCNMNSTWPQDPAGDPEDLWPLVWWCSDSMLHWMRRECSGCCNGCASRPGHNLDQSRLLAQPSWWFDLFAMLSWFVWRASWCCLLSWQCLCDAFWNWERSGIWTSSGLLLAIWWWATGLNRELAIFSKKAKKYAKRKPPPLGIPSQQENYYCELFCAICVPHWDGCLLHVLSLGLDVLCVNWEMRSGRVLPAKVAKVKKWISCTCPLGW